MTMTLLSIAAGGFWTAIIWIIFGVMGGFPEFGDLPAVLIPSLITSFIITFIFRRRLSRRGVIRDRLLPFRTLAWAVLIWPCACYAFGIVRDLVASRTLVVPFDGFWFMMIMSVAIGLVFGLPLTYPAAYFTQKAFGAFAKKTPLTG